MKKIITFILTAAVAGTSTGVLAYDKNIAQSAQEYKILEGDENGSLNLDEYVTRAETAKILCSVMQLGKSAKESGLTDISSHWAKDYINAAVENKLVNGFEDKSFRPDDKVTYEQAIKMILGESGGAVYPTDYVAFAIEHNLLENVNALMSENITRGDIAQILTNLINAIKDDGVESYYYSGLEQLNALYKQKNKYSGDTYIYPGSTSGSSAAAPAPNLGAVQAPESAMKSDADSADFNSSNSSSSSSAGNRGGGGGSTAGGVIIEGVSPAYAPYINPHPNSESYSKEDEGIFKNAITSPLSTFSIDTDTASYSNMRRFAVNGQPIYDGAIRTEELINYFDYDLPQPADETPFSVTTEVAQCPWNSEHQLAMINIQGEEITERRPQNLVFLLDVSGSMYSYNKLPLVKRSMDLLLSKLDERDTVSIVTYASGTNVAASGLNAGNKDEIMKVINGLRAGGGTNGAGGLQLAYEQAEKFKCDGNNRIILCTDGDFNIGTSDNDDLKKLISEKRDNNIFISVLGFGMGNYKDDKMEIIADNGDGGYYYIDNLREAKKVLSDEMTSTLYTIAKDVKIQVEFNPAQVDSYRLIGYENRKLENEQFADDKVDAGELGAGASVTAFYEIIPAASGNVNVENAELRYQTPQYRNNGELMDVKLRYKLPEGGESILKEYPVQNAITAEPSDNFRFAAGVAELGMLLNKSEYAGTSSYDSVLELTRGSLGEDELGFRHEFVQMVDLIRFVNR
ncbi:MAG: von Willebrand factor type A domain-containing protein [bacterium]|nr:von Willebrand factor type A domain-containing protein [bacterium]